MNKQKLIIGGATGLVGRSLTTRLQAENRQVQTLVRPQTKGQGIPWNPRDGVLDGTVLEGADAVIHLGGAGVADKAWTRERKALIRDSRVQSTTLLAQTLAGLEHPPEVFICASAIGYYGNRGDQIIDEQADPADDFLGTVCREWEESTRAASQAGIRVVLLRIGIVLATDGGALAKMRTPFKLGLGGPVGSGQQYMSWIHLDDVVGSIIYCLDHREISGPVNVTAPHPQTNSQFGKTLGRVLGRPAILPMPGFMISLLFGEMGRELLLGGARVLPKVLQGGGYEFRYPRLEGALNQLLNET